MSILTCVRWYLIVVLICISLKISQCWNTSMWFFRKQWESNWPPEIVLLTVCCFEFFLRYQPKDVCWGLVYFTDSPTDAVNIKCPREQVFQLLLPKVATRRQHFLMRHCFSFVINLAFIFCWRRADFQCCVCYRYTETWFSYTWTFICFFLSDSFPISVPSMCSVDVCVLFTRSFWIIYLISTMCMLIPAS